MKYHSFLRLAGLSSLLAITGASAAHAEAFSFGVLGDTQWSGTDSTGNNVNSVAVNQVNACNAAFVAAGVDFVVQVGDLTDNGSVAGLQTRLNANKTLTDAGIAFYGLRGNHEDNSTAQSYFNANYIPSSSASATVSVCSGDTSSYSVTYKNTKIVLLDITGADSTSTMDKETSWMNTQLQAGDHTQAFVFDHKNLQGENHKDNIFGGGNDVNPTEQNAFISTLQNNNVRLYISGHDHMANRSIVTSPDGTSSVQQVITASDSYKYYTPSTPISSREAQISQQLGKTGYYIYTVDGDNVTGKYYSTTPLANGDVPANAKFTLQEVFGYSLNGKEVQIAKGATQHLLDNTSLAIARGGVGYLGTTADLLLQNNNTAKDFNGRYYTKVVDSGWSAATGALQSDILHIWGNDTVSQSVSDPMTLTLSYTGSDAVRLVHLDAAGNWVDAGTNLSIDGNDNLLTATISEGGDYAVIPEPSTYAIALGVIALGWTLARRNLRKA